MRRISIKILLGLFTFVCLCFSANAQAILEEQEPFDTQQIIYKEASRTISKINPTISNNASGASYPGQRGTNQLIIYTKEYGNRTGTNEFGSEAIVENGTVVQLYGADSVIPQNGFVISGHGSAKNWINENITVGTKVYVDTETMTLYTRITSDSFVFAAREKIKEVAQIIRYYEQNNPCYEKKETESYLKRANTYLKKAERDNGDVQKYATTASNFANKALESALPYYPNEFKGVWIRPTETNEYQIASTINRLNKAGINNIFLETYFHGKTIYPSEVLSNYGVANQKEEFIGFDPLKIWIREAHKKNIKVHIWFETFYVGNKYNPLDATSIINAYPEWLNKTKANYDSTTPVPSVSEHNGYFLDPANPAVQKYLTEILKEIISKYKPDGINLDYIRYPQSVQAKFSNYENTNWGYTEYARNEFMSLNEVDPIDIQKDTTDWYKWSKYRQDKITAFVRETKKLTSQNDVKLTTVIFPDRQRVLETKMQDWRSWSVYNYVDGLTPLILTCDKQTASVLINDIKKNSSHLTNIYPGLFIAFMGGAADDLLRQVHETRKLSMNGFVIFDYAHFDDKYIDVLSAGALKPDNYKVPQQDNTKKKKKRKKCSK